MDDWWESPWLSQIGRPIVRGRPHLANRIGKSYLAERRLWATPLMLPSRPKVPPADSPHGLRPRTGDASRCVSPGGSSFLQARASGKYPLENPNHFVATSRLSGARKIAARSAYLCLAAILASTTSLAGDGARTPRSHRLMVMCGSLFVGGLGWSRRRAN